MSTDDQSSPPLSASTELQPQPPPSDASAQAPAKPSKRAEELEGEIEEARDNLGALVGELDQRRHRLFDIPGQLRKHALPLTVGALALAGAVAGGLTWRNARRSSAARIAARAGLAGLPRRLMDAVPIASGWLAKRDRDHGRDARATKTADPTKAGPVWRRLLVAAAVAAAGVAGKRAALYLANRRRAPAPNRAQ